MKLGLLLLTCVLITGCGYRWSSRLDAGPSRTVSLDTVGSSLFPPRPGLEYDLTRRLKDEIATDRRLVLTDGGADVRLRVTLVEFTEPILVEDLRTGAPAEIQLQAAAIVDAAGQAFANGRVRQRVSVSTSYTPGTGDSRAEGLQRLWRELSREILDVAADHEWATAK